jgi:regulator of sigma E protease
MLLTWLTFFIVLSVLVLVHELGHFLAAKKGGITVEEFGLGYPPRLWSKKIKGVVYSLNAIPFGGFVKLYGEELEEKKTSKGAFWSKSKKVRTSVIVAGVLANLVLAITCFSLVYSISGIPTKTNQVKIVDLAQDSPAQISGLKKEDQILAVDEVEVKAMDDFTRLIREKKGQEIKLLISRNGSMLSFLITPRENPPAEEGPLGVIVTDIEIIKYPFWQMPFRGIIEGFKEAFGWTSLILSSLKKMAVDLLAQGKVPKDVAGPIGIFQITSGVAQEGILTVIQFIGVLSVNLMILNILPIPAMDGGRLLFILYEVISKRRPKPEVEHWINTIGLAFLLALLVLITINDLSRL